MAASTTQKLTLGVLALIYRYCVAMNCGVIVRLKGEDVGITADDFASEGGKVTWLNAPAKFNTLTIPKETVKQIGLDFWVEEQLPTLEVKTQTAIWWDDLDVDEQIQIQDRLSLMEMYDWEFVSLYPSGGKV